MNKKRIICVLLSVTVAALSLTSCKGKSSKDADATTKPTAVTSQESTSQSTTTTTTTEASTALTTLTPSEVSSRSEATSREAMSKAKEQATQKTAEKTKGNVSTTKKTTKKTTQKTSPSKGAYEVDKSSIKHYIGNIEKAWIVGYKNFPGLYVQIGRVSLDKSITQRFDSSINKQIVNPKNVTYKPACSVAVIVCDSPTQLKMSTGDTHSNTESIAKSVGANIAVNGRESYGQDSAAVIRNGAIYKSYTGIDGKAGLRLVMYKDGTWRFIRNFDNATAKAELEKGAYNSTAFQDITIADGVITASYNDNPYRNRTFIGQVSSNKYVLMTTEFMPIKDAAEVLKAYGVQNAIQINGGNCSQLYVRGIGNTTGSTGNSVKSLNKVGYLETEWFAKQGLLEAKKGGGPCNHEIDIVYFK